MGLRGPGARPLSSKIKEEDGAGVDTLAAS
jgi:hypothetical protein